MQSDMRGNFLLQALLAIALVMSFMSFMAPKLSARKSDAAMAAIARQAETAARAARQFVRANKSSIVYGPRNIAGDEFSDLLEPFGLPLGFVPLTTAQQKISLLTSKNDSGVLALIVLQDGKISDIKRRELMARIGSDAASADNDGVLHGIGGWEKSLKDFGIKPDSAAVYILVPADDDFSELIRRSANDSARNKFHIDLSMGGMSVKNSTSLSARNAELGTANFGTLSITGSSDERKFKNKIELVSATRAVFQTRDGANALNISKGDLNAKSLSAQTLFKYGIPGAVDAGSTSINSLSMAVGRSGFIGMYDWDIHSDVILNNVSIDTEHLEINGFINASRGQDVFIDKDELTYSTKSGVETRTLSAASITLRDQVSSALLSGSDGAVILDIRPAGVSVLTDVLSDTINNDAFEILKNPAADDGTLIGCRNIISSLSSAPTYNSKSAAQNIVCQFVFWQRLERRINIKQCMLDGGSNCG